MNKTHNGLKVAATLACLMTLGLVAETGTSLQGQVVSEGIRVAAAPSAGCGCNAPAEIIYSEPTPVYSAPVASCGCQKSGCTSCLKRPAKPQCDCQYCELEAKKGEVEKTEFKTEQKEVCIPAVRLPWKKNCPPKRSRVRTVNVLKKKKYKVPKCQYKWSVHEPEDFAEPTAATKQEASEGQASGSGSKESGSGTKEAVSGETEGIISIYPDPAEALGDVPRPPIEN